MADEAFWNAKLARVARETFATLPMPTRGVPATARHAATLAAFLRSHGPVEAASLGHVATAAGIPRKFVSRAVGLLVRYRLVAFKAGPPVRLVRRPDAYERSKNASPTLRGPVSKRERAQVYESDGYRCGRCGIVSPASELAVDHIVPLSFMGADEPGNWVTLCRRDNAEKSDGFESSYLRHFRGKDVVGTVGVRFVDGAFWPFINGRTQRDTRTAWKEPGRRNPKS